MSRWNIAADIRKEMIAQQDRDEAAEAVEDVYEKAEATYIEHAEADGAYQFSDTGLRAALQVAYSEWKKGKQA